MKGLTFHASSNSSQPLPHTQNPCQTPGAMHRLSGPFLSSQRERSVRVQGEHNKYTQRPRPTRDMPLPCKGKNQIAINIFGGTQNTHRAASASRTRLTRPPTACPSCHVTCQSSGRQGPHTLTAASSSTGLPLQQLNPAAMPCHAAKPCVLCMCVIPYIWRRDSKVT